MSALAVRPRRFLLALAVPVLAVAVIAASLARSTPVFAANTFTVDTTADLVAAPGTQTCNTPCSLREALQAADNRATIGGLLTTTIGVNSGTYNLSASNGALQVGALSGEVVSITGGGGVTINQAPGCTEPAQNCMVLFLDPNSVGNVTVHIDGLAIAGGNTTFGGGGIAGGAISPAAGDTTTITNTTIQNNTSTGAPGGGIGYFHGTLTISNSTISGNTAATASGGGIDFTDIDPGGGTLTITNTTFSGNSTTQAAGGGGGAVHILGTNAVASIDGSIFTGNTASSSVSPGGGGAIDKESGTLTVTNSTFTTNAAGSGGSGGAINTSSGTTHLDTAGAGNNRFVGNTAGVSGTAFYKNPANVATVTAENNWWGTNTPSGVVANVTPTNFYQLRLSASPAFVARGGATTLTADLTKNNAGTTQTGLPNVSAIPVTWSPAPTFGSLSNTTGTLSTTPGTATATYTAGGTSGTGTASVQVDGATVSANIPILFPPTIGKAFGAASVPLNGTTSLSFTVQNPNTTTGLTGVAFSDTLPGGLVISTPNGLSGSCGAGTITATQGTSVVSLTGGTLAASANCTFAVNVTGVAAGTQNNTSGNVTSTEGGTGGTASATLTVEGPPVIAKSFSPTSIALNATTSLTFTVINPAANPDALTSVAFTDTLPTGLTVANSSAAICGGTLTTTAPNGISLTGATIATNSQCQFAVTVTGGTAGSFTNTTGAVSSTNGGTGNTASGSLTVVAPPAMAKAFGAAAIPLNGTTSLTFTLNNPNTSTTLTGLAFTDNLPAGLVVATPPSPSSTCGGTLTASAGSGTITLSGGTAAASSGCTVSVNIQGTTAGVKNNSVQVSSTEGGTGNTASASITVVAPPVLIKSFGAASIPLNGSTSLSFTVQNPNTTTGLTGVAFSDTLPGGLVISTPNGLSGSCGGGTITASQGTGVVSLSGASLAASANCTFAVNVTGVAAGTQNNTSGNVTSTEGGTGGTASASVDVVAPPSIAKAFGSNWIAPNGVTTLTFAITNPGANATAENGVAFTDSLPAGLVVATPSGLANGCGGTAIAVAGGSTISLTGGSIATPGAQCQLTVNVTGAAAGIYTNTSGAVTSTNGGTGNMASASLTIVQAPSIAKAFGAASIPLNGTTSLTLTITNPNSNVTLTGLAFNDALPSGLQVASPPNLINGCGGTATAAAGAAAASLSNGTLAPSTSCTFSVSVQGTTGGVKNNSVAITSTEGGNGNTSSASITVVLPPTIAKAFGASPIAVGSSTSLTFTLTNPNGGTILTGIGVGDTLPSGLVVATPNGLAGSCGGGTVAATQGSSSISLSGATLAPGASCTFSVNVTAATAGTKVNTSGAVFSNEGGTGTAATASLTVQAPSIAVVSSANPATEGVTSVTYTATVGPTPPAGTVTFFDGGTAISGCSNLTPNGSGVIACAAGVYPTAGTHPITATYSYGPVNSSLLSEVVADAALNATAGANLTGTEGSAIASSVLATFTDGNPNGVVSDFTASIDWGDSTTSAGTVAAAGGHFQVSAGHTYTDAGVYTVTVAITDTKGGATATPTLAATIADLPLSLTATQSLTATTGQQFTGTVASFTDPVGKEPTSEYVASIDWGDGNVSAGTVVDPPGTFTITGSHTYGAPATYTVTVTVRETDPNASATVSSSGSIAVAPAASFPNTTAPQRRQPFLLIAGLALALFVAGAIIVLRRRKATRLR